MSDKMDLRKYVKVVYGMLPMEVKTLPLMVRASRAQGSLEYVMMIATASIVIVMALVMIVKLKTTIPNNVLINGTNYSITSAISQQLSRLSAGSA
jgi:hypothetical protein